MRSIQMRRIQKVWEVGNSLGITVEKEDAQKLGVKKGDKLEFEFIGKVE